MGKGDRRTFRGKLFRNSHGNARPHGVRTRVADKAVSKGATRRTAIRRK